MNISLLGATGATGHLLVERLNSTDRDLRILARNPERVAASKAEILAGDATDPTSVIEVVRGADVVITMVAAARDEKPGTVRSASTRVIVDAIRAEAPQAWLVAVSAVGGERSIDQLTRPARMIYRRVVGASRLAEVDRQEEIVERSGLRYTLVRPPRLDDKPASGAMRVDRVTASSALHRSDLADTLVELIGHPSAGAVTLVSR